MKVIILAGGLGSRLAEETYLLPKPMVEIGGKPILWHIMKIYATQGYKDFLIACGYKGRQIKSYFHNYNIQNNDYFLNLADGKQHIENINGIDWEVGLIDTGLETQTGGRIRRLRKWTEQSPFMVTYGDGVGNIDLNALLDFHHAQGKLATLTAVRPPSRFGAIQLQGDLVANFSEKPQTGEGWINGGFFVFEPGIFKYLFSDDTILERSPLEKLASENQLSAYRHQDFWHPMDTLRDKRRLEKLWDSGKAPWKMWK